MRSLNNLKISAKLMIPILLQLVLLLTIIYFYLAGTSMIQEQEKDKKSVTQISESVRDLSYTINDYLNSKATYDKLTEHMERTAQVILDDAIFGKSEVSKNLSNCGARLRRWSFNSRPI